MKAFIVFDLDDTLFPERDFVEGAFREMARHYNVPAIASLPLGCRRYEASFDEAAALAGCPVAEMVAFYRSARPALSLEPSVGFTLGRLRAMGCGIGLLTEGRLSTQQAKIDALGLERFLTKTPAIMSPGTKDFAAYTCGVEAPLFVSVGDNPAKDFSQPASMGWLTVMLRDHGRNVHPQPFSPEVSYVIDSISELPDLLNNLYPCHFSGFSATNGSEQ